MYSFRLRTRNLRLLSYYLPELLIICVCDVLASYFAIYGL